MGFLPAVRNWLDLDWVEDPRQMIYMWNVLTATWITWVWLGFCWSPVGVCTRFLASFNMFQQFRWTNEILHHVLWGTSNIIVVHGSSGNWIDGISGGSKMAAPPWESYVDGMPMAYHITPDRDIGYVCQAWLKLVWITLSFYSNWDHSTTFHLTPRGSGSVFPMLPKTSFCPLESDPTCRSWVSHLLYVLLARQRGSHVQ